MGREIGDGEELGGEVGLLGGLLVDEVLHLASALSSIAAAWPATAATVADDDRAEEDDVDEGDDRDDADCDVVAAETAAIIIFIFFTCCTIITRALSNTALNASVSISPTVMQATFASSITRFSITSIAVDCAARRTLTSHDDEDDDDEDKGGENPLESSSSFVSSFPPPPPLTPVEGKC